MIKKHGNCGKICSLEHKMKLSKFHTGKKLSNATKLKISKFNLGKKHSDETKLKISLSKIGKKGELSPGWKGGRSKDFHGYIIVHSPNHPNKNNKGYIREHRLVMEKHLGRYLTKKEIVHHEDEDRSNNKLENLKLFKNKAAHTKHHRALKKELGVELK